MNVVDMCASCEYGGGGYSMVPSKCAECRSYSNYKKGSRREMKILKITPVVTPTEGVWPRVRPTDWCSEWEEAPTGTTDKKEEPVRVCGNCWYGMTGVRYSDKPCRDCDVGLRDRWKPREEGLG